MTMTTAQLGLILLTGATMAFVFGVFATVRVFALIIGIVLVAATGTPARIFHWAAGVVGWGSSLTDSLTTWGLGVAFPGLFAIILAGIVIYDLHPKGGRASRRTFWAAAGLAVLVAAGSTNVSFLNNIGPAITHGVQQSQSNVSGG
jgi:hypothetical protein